MIFLWSEWKEHNERTFGDKVSIWLPCMMRVLVGGARKGAMNLLKSFFKFNLVNVAREELQWASMELSTMIREMHLFSLL